MKKNGFTLAETLITLGIIGIVSALTMAVLAHNIQKIVLKNQFKKTYNTLSNAVNKVYTDLEYIPLCSYGVTGDRSECGTFNKQFLGSLNVIKKCTKAKEQGCIKHIRALVSDDFGSKGLTQSWIDAYNHAYILKDGSMIMLYGEGNSVPIYIIDINGSKGPNKWGYDQYYFYIYNNKLVCYYNNTIDIGGTKCSDIIKMP